jgi:predicted small metal-binding protein
MNKLPTAPSTSSPAKLDLFLDRLAAQSPRTGKLVFALDATASRQPTWDRACELQAEMFTEAAGIGGLEVQLVYYRGQECRASGWMTDGKKLGEIMRRIECVGGFTQIAKVLRHARQAHDKTPISALVFVGDAMEESIDTLCAGAHELGARGIKTFMFQEGDDAEVEKAFREVARLTHGAYCRFAPGAANELRELLRAVAAYAAGGLKALGNMKAATAVKLLEQLK